jgi:hypothetical protein
VDLDFNGDQVSDIGFITSGVKSASPLIFSMLMSDGTLAHAVFGKSNTHAVSADYDGDQITDLATVFIKDRRLSIWTVQLSKSKQTLRVPFAASADFLIAGCDFDGDKRADLAGYSNTLRSLYYLKSSATSGRATRVALRIPEYVRNFSCADINGDGAAELITLSQIPAQGDTPARSIIRAFTARGTLVFKRTVRSQVDGIFAMQVVLGDAPVVGYYTLRVGTNPIRQLNLFVPSSTGYTLGKMRISPVTDFVGGVYARKVTTPMAEIKAYPGLLGINNRGNMYRLDLSDLAAGLLPPADENVDVSTLISAFRQKNTTLLKAVTVVAVPQ